MNVFGVDIGGSGIKGAPVDLTIGKLAGRRYRVDTPKPSTVAQVVAAVVEVVGRHPGQGHVGIAFPGVVIDGITRTAANLDQSWIDAPAAELFGAELGRPVSVLNDADAAGLAEMTFGAGRGQRGVTVMLTFGTGIGSAVFLNGRLVPNTEFGHLELHGSDAELYASDRARRENTLDWPVWAARMQEYLTRVEQLLRPELVVIGGGVSKKTNRWLPAIHINAKVVPATLKNHAGIIGAAFAATARH